MNNAGPNVRGGCTGIKNAANHSRGPRIPLIVEIAPSKDDRRRDILDAALACFAAKGLVDNTIKEIRPAARPR
ncbi:hypothetical protein MPRM_21040 [Mycobacterium parmense]|uniref:Uncharacterized protein n=1 Tax=Mycobacterium parmense TaxID=185642 RepID=A0A7I7YV01_9MYCO|nr:hypothetical protein MPRM_21040 [Mycobacterium parmense]